MRRAMASFTALAVLVLTTGADSAPAPADEMSFLVDDSPVTPFEFAMRGVVFGFNYTGYREQGGALFPSYPPRSSPRSSSVAQLSIEDASSPVISVVNQGTTASYGVFGFPFDLHPPFRWEVTGGRILPGTTGPMSGFFCTELDTRDSSPLEFHTICAQPSGDGFQVWVARAGENLLGLTTVGPAEALDLAVEHDGNVLTFLARPASEGEYQVIHSLDHAPVAALVPAFGGAQLPPGARVDYTRFRVVSNGPLPGGATPVESRARTLMDTAGPMVDAYFALGGDPSDAFVGEEFAAASLALRDASRDLRAAAKTLPDAKAAKRAAKTVKKVSAEAKKTANLIARGKPLVNVWYGGVKTYLSYLLALQQLDPHALPGK